MARDDASLLDIVNAARLVQIFVQDMAKEDFLVDLKTQSAVLHQITVIGEAVRRLSPAFRERHPVLPWSLMAGMRAMSSMVTMLLTWSRSGILPIMMCQTC